MMQQKRHYIAISGNIGAGKTSLTNLLAKHFNWTPIIEKVDDNPYLPLFYKDMQRWAFHLQIHFLQMQLAQNSLINNTPFSVVQDRLIHEIVYIFTLNMYQTGIITEQEWTLYEKLFNTCASFCTKPDLLIYLRASVPKLVDHITKRGRTYEQNIRLDYLQQLNENYENWIKTYTDTPLLIINVDQNNFVNNPQDLGQIIESINSRIHGILNI